MESNNLETTTSRVLHLRRNRNPAELPSEAGCLQDLFEAQVDATPNATALICDGRSWTYSELDRTANRLARLLRFYDVGPGQLVGLYFERSAQPIIAILGCLKAGAGYVPIDPVHPKERIQHILTESNATVLLTETSLASLAAERYAGTTLVLDQLGTELTGQPDWRLMRHETGAKPSDLAYVLYTSGTTGRPKGVMAEHQNVFQYVHAMNQICPTTPMDRVYQGFSLGFDGSIEEIWMAFSNGSALVVGTKDTPKFGNDLAKFLNDHQVSYFSTVPTLLSTMSESIPSLRLLVVSGEACPPEIVDRWATDDCRLWNVYGPTEATVNTTAADCRRGKPVTIGRPLPGYHLYILDEHLRPVPHGEKGELYVGGNTLARGYLGQPELTDSRFVTVYLTTGEGPTRLYRTGDLVRWNEEENLEFFGRIDGQIKIRGYRVELSEIESVLRESPSIRSAVVKLVDKDGLSQLAAYVLPENPGQELDRNELLELLHKRLPDYMVPSYLDALTELPMLASGKADRAHMPEPVSPLQRTDTVIVEPANDLEAKLAEVWKKTLGIPQVSVEANFFLDLGGHSLLAAQMVTRLRDEFGLDAAIRDAYRFPTIRQFANSLTRQAPAADLAATAQMETRPQSSREVFAEQSVWIRRLTATLQAASLVVIKGLKAAPLLLSLWISERVYLGEITWQKGALEGLILALALWPVSLTIAIASKWILIGRYQAGQQPLWGLGYFRWWLASRLQTLSGAGFFAGTPMMSVYYRLMGAKVGRHCSLDTAMVSAWDLISIGDDTSIGADTQLLGYRVEDGMLNFGPITIGQRCFVGLHSAFGLHVHMADDSRLDDQSLLPDGDTIPAGEGRRGSPAQKADVEVPTEIPERVSRLRRVGFSLAHLAATYAMGLAMLPLGLSLLAVTLVSFWIGGLWVGIATQILIVPLGTFLYCLYVALLKRIILGQSQPGVYSLHSAFYLRKWLVDGLIRGSRAVLLPLYTTLYLPPWLRMLGAKIGKRAELSTVWYFSPEMMEVGEESFFADGCIIGGRRTFGGKFQLAINHVGRRSFVGNSAILPTGAGLGDQCLLGVLSAPPTGKGLTENGTEWLGVPAFSLPNRPKPFCFDDSLTFHPTRKLYFQRAVIDGLRILIPGFISLTSLVASLAVMWVTYLKWDFAGLIVVTPFLSLGLSILSALSIIVLKKAVMGKFEPVTKPLWSAYVWLNEMVNGAYESVMNPAMAPFLGTPFLAFFLRLIGCKVGRHTFIESTLFSEWDLVEIGDYAALNAGSIIQTHLFEDRVMKSSHLKIGDECSVGNMAVVLYDTEMHQGASLAPLSLLMKGEKLNPFTKWHGIPTVPIARRAAEAFAGV